MYNLSVNKLPESLTPAVGGGIIDYESPNLDYAYNSVFESESDIHNYRIMPTQIKESMVLWYDIARQGCTNENMAQNSMLRDLSGNGHDATCYNFAWSGMSGIGGYSQNYNKKWYIDDTRVSATVTNIQINVTSVLRTLIGVYYQSNSDEVAFTVPSYKVRVSGLTDGQTITYRDGTNTVSYTIDRDGEYTLPQIDFSAQGSYYGFILNKVQESCNITIEQLPLYPNALVSDGVDDYAQVTNLHVLDDWTVFIEKDIIKYPASGWPLVDGGNSFDTTLQYKYEEASKFYINSFGVSTNVTDYVEKLDIFTPTSFNGNIIQKGDRQASRTLLCLFGGNRLPAISMALYNLIIFNRDLTPEEIEWVKRNLV